MLSAGPFYRWPHRRLTLNRRKIGTKNDHKRHQFGTASAPFLSKVLELLITCLLISGREYTRFDLLNAEQRFQEAIAISDENAGHLIKEHCRGSAGTEARSGSTVDLSRRKKPRWQVSLDEDQLTRISLVLNMHAALRVLFENPDNLYGFMTLANHNAFFHGRSPLEVIACGDLASLLETWRHLDALSHTT